MMDIIIKSKIDKILNHYNFDKIFIKNFRVNVFNDKILNIIVEHEYFTCSIYVSISIEDNKEYGYIVRSNFDEIVSYMSDRYILNYQETNRFYRFVYEYNKHNISVIEFQKNKIDPNKGDICIYEKSVLT